MSNSQKDFTPASEPSMGLLARMVLGLMMFIYRCHKFTAMGQRPPFAKFIIIAVPHTSNWDFPNYLGLTRELGLRTRFMAKSSLFKWPMHRFMTQVGGVPVDRSAKANMVQQMADRIAASDEFILTIAPAGTRSGSQKWRSGFYHIAMAAGIPIVCGFMDYGTRRAGLGPVIHPTGDYEKDMAPAFAFYKDMRGRR